MVSPYSSGVGRSTMAARRPRTGVFFCYSGASLYGVDLALAAARALHDRGEDYAWSLFLYGDRGPASERLAAEANAAGIVVHWDLSPDEVHTVLCATELVLRPTLKDGDAMVVREALDAGCRIVATNTVPRPRGSSYATRPSSPSWKPS